ncbi:MAG TPA: hypothetical protein VFN57_03540 [Thermomicrobiaceae bacterium]|nr:hypothetical protein [Thermomicrobiaceae bacterium]
MLHLTRRFGVLVPVVLIALLPSGGGAIALMALGTVGFAGGLLLRRSWSVAGVPLCVAAGMLGWVATHGGLDGLWRGLSPWGVLVAAVLYLLWFVAPTVLGAAAGVSTRRILDGSADSDFAG